MPSRSSIRADLARSRPTVRRCLALFAVLSLAAAAAGDVRFRTGVAILPNKPAAQAAGDAVGLAPAHGSRHIVVQFAGPVQGAQRAALRAAGLDLLSYLGDDAYFAAVAAGADRDAIAVAAPLRAAMDIRPAWKLHPALAAGEVVKWSVVELDKADPGNPTVAAYVLFHPDVGRAAARDLVQQLGGVVARELASLNGLVIEMPYQGLFVLAADDAVQWIEPPLPPWSEVNNSNRTRVGADTVFGPPYNLTGAGVDVLVYDGGQVFVHNDLAGRVTVGGSDTSGISSHATHVAGTIGGAGTVQPQYRGMAPAVDIISYGFEQEGGLHEGFLYTDPGDLEADYGEAINVYGADISNNSIGSNVEPNGFDCSWQGDYGVTSAVIDAVARGSVSGGAPFRIVWANGNERQGSRCDVEGFGDYYSIAPPADAKNHITVGALNSNDDSVTSFTSWGPTDDGRMKPDVSGPGCQSNDDFGVTSCTSSATGYTTLCGTSMSSPTVCGLSALLLEDYRSAHPGEPDFRGSTLKVLLAHTAADVQNAGPDYQTGYGSVRIPEAVDFLRSGSLVEAEVDNAGSYNVVVVVNPGDPVLRVTLAWDDAPGTPNVNPNLVNDLDLVVTSPSGVRAYPWTLNPANPSAPAVRTAENHRDNIEQVFVADPEVGGWSVEVRGTSVPEGPQPFSIAGSPLLVNCSSQGSIGLDRSRYNCSASATLRVVDCDLNSDDALVDTVNVTIASTSEPAGESVVLTEISPEAATFLGSIPLGTTDAAGVLHIVEGDTITATYVDADDGLGGIHVTVTDTATVDCTAPVISDVGVSNIGPRKATITFNTSEPAQGSTEYGDACGSPSGAKMGAADVTAHALDLTNLTPGTTYFFSVSAVDAAANAATDDNGGACFTFATPDVPNFFTEQFTTGSDLVGQMLTYVPDASIDRYRACMEPLAGGLPTDPTGGTNVSLGDDSSVLVNVAGGNTVKLYGTSWTGFYVGSNGYVTFGASDGAYLESYAAHFEMPRVSGWFDDLNPLSGGSVSYKQLADRVAITWLNVPEYNTGNQNTFQIELFFDGTIRTSWLTMAAPDGIAGLSEGVGLDVDFGPSDLSAVGDCGPRPPIAQDVYAETATGQNVALGLIASDDGTPDPLVYIVLSLPVHGALSDPQAGAITSVPYTLAANGDTVVYDPAGSYEGPDDFTYKVNDGGTPPDGGDSNVATVHVTIGVPVPVYEFLVDDANPGWAVEGLWAFGRPTGGGSGNRDPTSGYTGQNVYGFNLNGDYLNSMPARYLTSSAIDCTGLTDVSVSFRRWLGVESSTYDHATFEVSNNGTQWVTVWANGVGSFSEASWSLQEYDISALADGQPAVYLRWAMGPTDSSVTYPGWNLDDIVIEARVERPPCPADLNGDGVVTLDDLSTLLVHFGLSGVGPEDGDLDGDTDVDLEDLSLMLVVFGLDCP